MGKEYDLTNFAYRELFYFCMQYHEYKREIEMILNSGGGSATYYQAGRISGGRSDSTAYKAMRVKYLKDKCEMIEQTALAVDPDIYQPLLKNVTMGVTYEHMKACDIEILCGRRQFYEKRRKFFYLLNLKRG